MCSSLGLVEVKLRYCLVAWVIKISKEKRTKKKILKWCLGCPIKAQGWLSYGFGVSCFRGGKFFWLQIGNWILGPNAGVESSYRARRLSISRPGTSHGGKATMRKNEARWLRGQRQAALPHTTRKNYDRINTKSTENRWSWLLFWSCSLGQ